LTVHVSSIGNPTNGVVTVATGEGKQSAKVSHGVATITLPRYSAGSHTVTAQFGGTATTTMTKAVPKSFTVTKVASSLTASTNPTAITSHTAHAVLTVTIHAGAFHPSSGKITIYDLTNGKRNHLGDTTPSNGTAHFTLPRFDLGQHDLQISYAGTSSVAASAVQLTERVPAR
jgi:large repetitive protein